MKKLNRYFIENSNVPSIHILGVWSMYLTASSFASGMLPILNVAYVIYLAWLLKERKKYEAALKEAE